MGYSVCMKQYIAAVGFTSKASEQSFPCHTIQSHQTLVVSYSLSTTYVNTLRKECGSHVHARRFVCVAISASHHLLTCMGLLRLNYQT